MASPSLVPPPLKLDARLNRDHPDHKSYIDLLVQWERHAYEQAQDIFAKTNDWWDLFLAIQEDRRDKVDEQWRSDAFVPLPFSTTRTKVAQMVELLGNTEPIYQVEASRETSNWYEQARHYERYLDYVLHENRWRKQLYKLATCRSVQGTAMFKTIWGRRAHTTSLFATQAEYDRFNGAMAAATQIGFPQPPNALTEPEMFEKWRDLVNKSNRGVRIPAMPVSGKRDIVEYEGPIIQQLPLWAVRLDAMTDELENQKLIIHRMVKPRSYVERLADDDPNSPLPYLRRNVEAALHGWDGQVLEQEQQQLSEAMGVNAAPDRHPYYRDAVEIWEVWSPEEPFQYSIVLNRSVVINKRPFEWPLLTTAPNVFALRNVIVPGYFYGLSDYQEPEKLFRELNTFRRMRMDGAMLTTLPVFVKQQGVHLTEALKKLRPGMILSLPTKDAIQSLIRHTLPAEAYREPAEIKYEIQDATEVYDSTKGAPATVGRVTGTEYQGRSANTLLKYKVDATIVEEELAGLPRCLISLAAQMGQPKTRIEIGGDPDAIVDLTREQLVAGLGMRFRFRGATKHISPDLQVQQLNMVLGQATDILTVPERRFALGLLLDLLDVRGSSKILSLEGEQQMQQMAQAQAGAANAQAGATMDQSRMMGVQVPGQLDPKAAAAVGGGSSGGRQPSSPEEAAQQGQGGGQPQGQAA